jgi:putative tributyrin esterase
MLGPSSHRGSALSWLACFLLCVTGCHRQQPLDRPQMTAGVGMRDVTFYSVSLGREMPYRVFLPQARLAGQRFPVVYLLHGNGGDFRDWSNDSSVSQYAAQRPDSSGLILVMPEGKSSYYLNAVERSKDKYEDYLTRDLIHEVENRFPAQVGREHRAVIGVSMGGFAALKLALSRQDLYSFAGAISPPVDVPERRFTWKRAGQYWEFRNIFGPIGSAERKARNPFDLVQSANINSTAYLYLSAGEQEPLREPIQRFEKQLKWGAFMYEFHLLPGGHDWGEWDAQIPGCFEALSRTLHKTAAK